MSSEKLPDVKKTGFLGKLNAISNQHFEKLMGSN